MRRFGLLLAATLLIASCCSASTLFRSDPWEYYTDYTSYVQGAKVVAHAELYPTCATRQLTGWNDDKGKHAKESLLFADKNQHEWFVIDLGQPRPIGKLVVPTGLSDTKRVPATVSVQGSLTGPDGPWTTLVEKGDPSCKANYLLDNSPARWIKVDLGENTDGVGSRVGRHFGIYKRWKLPKTAELMQAFYPKIKRDHPGLEEFWKKIDAKDWTGAASALRTFEEKRYMVGTGAKMPEGYWRDAKLAVEDKIDFGNDIIFHFKQGVDWEINPDNLLNTTERGWAHGHVLRGWSESGDRRYSDKFVEWMTTYLEQLPRPPVTVSSKYEQWATLGVAGRIGHWIQILGIIVKNREVFSDELFLNVLYSLWEQVDYLRQGGKENGNWLAAVTRAVMAGGKGWPEFAESTDWLNWASDRFELNVMRDIRVDGKEEENSDGYVAFAYGIMVNIYDGLTQAGVEIPRAVDRRIKLGADWLSWITQPNGRTYMIGDSNGGMKAPIGWARKWNRDDLVYMCTQGKEGKRPSTNSRDFPISGWYVMRSDWDERPFDQARHLLLTAAQAGPHGHQDQLSIYCYAYGRSLLWVPCRLNDASYVMKEHWETLRTWSKNTVVVDGQSQPFGYEPGVDRGCKNVMWHSDNNLDMADATHTMYPDVSHRRRVLFMRDDYWIVIDDLTLKADADPEKEHTYDQHFHFKEGTDVVTMRGGAVRSDYPTAGNLMLVPLEPDRLAASEKTSTPVSYIGQEAPTMYGWKYTLKGKGAQRFVTVLYPYPRGPVPSVSVRKLDAAPGVAAFEVTTPKGRDIVYAGDTVETHRYSAAINARARVFVCRMGRDGETVATTALEGQAAAK